MIDLLRLTRPINLLIIAITMAMMRYGLLGGLLQAGGRDLLMTGIDFWLLVLSTMLIAAAGNMINDYFDTRIDRINKPDK
jgi:4-hydroxybenzoate polyprenyltransferase